MLNRRLLRVKVMQALYAFFQSDKSDLARAEKELFLSIDRLRELFLYFLLLPIELAAKAEIQMEEARNKVMPTNEDLHPNRKFVDNPVIKKLAGNPFLKAESERRKINWTADQELVKTVWKQLRKSELYQRYMEAPKADFSHHRQFVMNLYNQLFQDNELLFSHFQERSIYWDFEDSDFAVHIAMRYVKKLSEDMSAHESLPQLYKDEEEDKRFVKQLFRKTISANKENEKEIEKKTRNWEVERIAVMDILCMKMAITEFLHFSSIPVKVTLNEYIEISKLFSTPKSKLFINGVLDKLLAEYRQANKIKKRGRGLMQ